MASGRFPSCRHPTTRSYCCHRRPEAQKLWSAVLSSTTVFTGAKWFPDGRQIVFRRLRGRSRPACYVQSVETGKPRPFTPDGMMLCQRFSYREHFGGHTGLSSASVQRQSERTALPKKLISLYFPFFFFFPFSPSPFFPLLFERDLSSFVRLFARLPRCTEAARESV